MSENKQNLNTSIDKPGFFINRHYLTDMSFENPRGPVSVDECTKIKNNLEVALDIKENKDEDIILLTLTLEAMYQGKAAFVCEISYCAHVAMHQVPEQVKPQILNVSVPTSLIPFLNNAVDHAAKAAGYPGINIGNIDFDQIYKQKTSNQLLH